MRGPNVKYLSRSQSPGVNQVAHLSIKRLEYFHPSAATSVDNCCL